jgi:hypothetical protein
MHNQYTLKRTLNCRLPAPDPAPPPPPGSGSVNLTNPNLDMYLICFKMFRIRQSKNIRIHIYPGAAQQNMMCFRNIFTQKIDSICRLYFPSALVLIFCLPSCPHNSSPSDSWPKSVFRNWLCIRRKNQ